MSSRIPRTGVKRVLENTPFSPPTNVGAKNNDRDAKQQQQQKQPVSSVHATKRGQHQKLTCNTCGKGPSRWHAVSGCTGTFATSTSTNTSSSSTTTSSTTTTLTSNLQWPSVTLDVLSECSVEFLQMVITEANELATQQKNIKTGKNLKSVSIEPKFIFAALKTLGFESYIEQAQTACTKMNTQVVNIKKQKKKRRKKNKLTKKQAQHIAEQQALLFAAAADAFGGEDAA